MKFSYLISLAATFFMTGCVTVDMASKTESSKAKEFSLPTEGKTGVYIYRYGSLGRSFKKDIWIDGKCVGESAENVFFYIEVDGNKIHRVETESEFSPNGFDLMFESGKNYYIQQIIKMGLVVAGADIEEVTEEEGKFAVSRLPMAKAGKCSSKR